MDKQEQEKGKAGWGARPLGMGATLVVGAACAALGAMPGVALFAVGLSGGFGMGSIVAAGGFLLSMPLFVIGVLIGGMGGLAIAFFVLPHAIYEINLARRSGETPKP